MIFRVMLASMLLVAYLGVFVCIARRLRQK